MNVLLIKTSSLGDVLHALPAVTDAHKARPEIRFDWVVEESLVDIPSWHPAVARIIPYANRRWRGDRIGLAQDLRRFLRELRARRYDLVLDAQGLMKSAIVCAMARGRRCGMSFGSARESFAALGYQRRIHVDRGLHAIDRQRRLFAAALGYGASPSEIDYGIADDRLGPSTHQVNGRYLVFLHGTSWPSKCWPESYWRELIQLAAAEKLTVLLPAGNSSERERAGRLAAEQARARVLPPLELSDLARLLSGAAGAVAVDTGLGHLAAALATPCVSIYGASDPRLTGTRGKHQHLLSAEFGCAPCLQRRCGYTGPSAVTPACYGNVPPLRVWGTLLAQISQANS